MSQSSLLAERRARLVCYGQVALLINNDSVVRETLGETARARGKARWAANSGSLFDTHSRGQRRIHRWWYWRNQLWSYRYDEIHGLWISMNFPMYLSKANISPNYIILRLPDSASPKESVCLYSWLPLHSSTIFTFLSWFKDGTIITTYCWAGFFLLEDSRNNIVRRESLREQCIQDFIRLAPSKFDSATCNLMRCSSCLLATICPGKYRKSQSLTLRDGCHKRWCFAFKTETPS